MKLVLIITGLNTGGAETMLLKLLERLDTRFSAHVISLTSLGVLGARIAALGVPVDALGMRKGIQSSRAFMRLVRRLRALKPDVVQTFMYHADLLGGLAARLVAVPRVAWGIRNSGLALDRMSRTTRWTVRVCAQLSRHIPDRLVFCSHPARDRHVELGYDASRALVIDNGFDLDRFRPDAEARVGIRRELGISIDAPLVGMIARLDPQKNHHGFFQAAGQLHRRMPHAHYLLAVSGIDLGNADLRRWIEREELTSVVHLLGPREDIPRLLAALDICTLSSWGESFPNVLGEAMACGVPCVATDVGASRYIVGQTGQVVAPGDMTGLARAWERLLRVPGPEQLVLSQQARDRVATHFEIGMVVKQYESLYDELAMNTFEQQERAQPYAENE